MKSKKYLKRMIPLSLRRFRSVWIDRMALSKMPVLFCDASPLATLDRNSPDSIFHAKELDEEWKTVEAEIASLAITDKASGVNPGDRRAIYYLIRRLKPRSVLEIGTHIGASTVHIATALRTLRAKEPSSSVRLVSIDICDVNDPASAPALKFGSRYTPLEMMNKIRCDDCVEFVTDSSLNYFSKCDRYYDAIFLDGDHAAATVYREIPAALKLLSRGGYILLHDYFPYLRPLWPDGALIPGPYLATQRLTQEGADIQIAPLGKLPWPTKQDSNVTSLALVTRSGNAHQQGKSRRA